RLVAELRTGHQAYGIWQHFERRPRSGEQPGHLPAETPLAEPGAVVLQRPDNVQRVVEDRVAAQQLELPFPGRLVPGDQDVVAVDLGLRNAVAADLRQHPARLIDLLVLARADRGSVHGTLEGNGPGLAEELDLVGQAVERPRRVERLAVVIHHHRHWRDLVLVHLLEQGDGGLGFPALVY